MLAVGLAMSLITLLVILNGALAVLEMVMYVQAHLHETISYLKRPNLAHQCVSEYICVLLDA